MASEGPFRRPAWSWNRVSQEQDDPSVQDDTPGSFPVGEGSVEPDTKEHRSENAEQSTAPSNEDGSHADAPRPKQRFGPRTCRICLEVIHPHIDMPPEGIASVLHPAPRVTYTSEDADLGRLIRPCKCKGSQRYVHEGCLQAWRYTDGSGRRKNMWECPTCRFKYRLERLWFSNMITNTAMEIVLTLSIMLLAIFLLGFVADPIIDLYLDPVSTLATLPTGRKFRYTVEDEISTWPEHFLKGFMSLGLLGVIKAFFSLPVWHIRGGLGGFGRARAGGGRNRLENISWTVVILGIMTFLYVS